MQLEVAKVQGRVTMVGLNFQDPGCEKYIPSDLPTTEQRLGVSNQQSCLHLQYPYQMFLI